ncbi:DUF5819 family protein [Streptomyces liliifuscus]|uniref:Uncharacterized protein n=1 Tax=Streptomyces liliifuscus TaxID=2797636 RepID=A0A7T7I7E9_9ACTN|nr:DUF5819 family protein [Streptomyces liliifuscus]QQM42147.1 hypothetical protein JEQ17_23700 [Streptomyces liliifuscus]
MDAYDKGSNARPVPGEPPAAVPDSLPPEGHETSDDHGTPGTHEPLSGRNPSGEAPARIPQQYGDQQGDEQRFDGQDDPQYDEQYDDTALAGPPLPPQAGIAALSLPFQIAAALALAVVAVAACVHVGMVFLHVAPSNTVTKQHGQAIDEWIYPEFEQNWKLFAPDPLQQNIAVQVRAEVRAADGDIRTTRWYDLSALDGAAIDGNLLPSHTQQNELRRAWDFFVATHDNANRPNGLRGALSEKYLRRIVVLRLDREQAGGRGAAVQQVQVRSRTTNVPPPKWSQEQVSDKPIVRELPWWPVSEADRAAGTRPAESTGTEASAR